MSDEAREVAFRQAKWKPISHTSAENDAAFEEHKKFRKEVEDLIAPQWAEKMNETYGLYGDPTAYTANDMVHDEQLEELHPGEDNNRAPLTTDLVQFVMYLRKNTDFFSGPNLDIKYPEASDPEFYEALIVNALLYTEE